MIWIIFKIKFYEQLKIKNTTNYNFLKKYFYNRNTIIFLKFKRIDYNYYSKLT